MNELRVALTAFVLIAPMELPDKTFVATLILSTRYRPVPVWLGVVTAFGLQCLLVVSAGRLVALLPAKPVQVVAAALFAAGAVALIRGAHHADRKEKEREHEYESRAGRSRTGWRAVLASFVVLFAAEWGDLSQLLTAGLVASGKPAVPVFLGSWAALAAVSGAAVLLGRWLLRRVTLSLVRYVAAGVCAVLAGVTLIGTLSAP
jgi:Ca2+/H+ antiporter, TMEM165/GDT1 family